MRIGLPESRSPAWRHPPDSAALDFPAKVRDEALDISEDLAHAVVQYLLVREQLQRTLKAHPRPEMFGWGVVRAVILNLRNVAAAVARVKEAAEKASAELTSDLND